MSRKAIAVTIMSAAVVAVAITALRATVAPQGGGPPGGPGGFGPPGGPGGFGPGTFLAGMIVRVADADEDGRVTPAEASKAAEQLVREADVDKKGSADAQALGRAFNRKLGPPPGFGDDDDGPGPGGPPPDFGPGTFLAPQAVAAADADKDGRLSPAEASKAAAAFIALADVAKKGSVDATALAAALNQRIGPPPGFGPGGPGGPMGKGRTLVKEFDHDGDGRLDRKERQEARASSTSQSGPGGRGPGGFGPPPGMFGGGDVEIKPGPQVDPASVKTFPDKPLYEPTVLRTLFLDFEDKDWDAELADFYKTDVDVPATLTVDGKKYAGVGVHYRGLSSYFAVPKGGKRSLNVSIDFTDAEQRLYGYKTLNLLNAHEDPSFLHTVLFFDIARQYLKAPKANLVKLVINGESWGVYASAQQFDKVFLTENFGSSKGARWKVPGNPGAAGGLEYTGDDVAPYRQRFEIKSSDDPKDWKALVALCRVLNKTPLDQLEKAIAPVLDVDGALWFLALDNALINGDGYWTRASDYSIYRDPRGQFHVIPHDANETFQPAMMFGPGGPGGPGGPPGGPGGFGGPPGGPGGGFGGPPGGPGGFGGPPGGPGGPGGGFGGPPGGFGGPARKADAKGVSKKGGRGGGFGFGPPPGKVDLDPLIGLDNTRTALRGRLLAVPALKARYLAHVRTIAEAGLDWKTLGPVVARYRALIADEVKADTRKLSSDDDFVRVTADTTPAAAAAKPARGPSAFSLRAFADQRRKFLLEYRETKKAAP
jgi:CotH kinase protein